MCCSTKYGCPIKDKTEFKLLKQKNLIPDHISVQKTSFKLGGAFCPTSPYISLESINAIIYKER